MKNKIAYLKKILFIGFLLNSFNNVNAQCWQYISCGDNHVLAIKNDGSLWAWGGNELGQLGNGQTTDQFSPIQIGNDKDWAKISAGQEYSLAIKNDGTLWAWGNNKNGQLGDGTTINKTVPSKIGSDADWQLISAGFNHSLAIKVSGSLWAWGNNNNSQLGNSGGNMFYPIQVGIDTDWRLAGAGGSTSFQHSVAIKKDGTLWQWGFLGGFLSGVPEQLGNEKIWEKLSVGSAHNLALKTDGSIWSWGSNWYGKLGTGSTGGSSDLPIKISSTNDWLEIAAGQDHSIAIKKDGSLWSWGRNIHGELGDGTKNDQSSAKKIGTELNWLSASAGNSFTIALNNEKKALASGSTLWGELGIGNSTAIEKLTPNSISCGAVSIGNHLSKPIIKCYPNPLSGEDKLILEIESLTAVREYTILNHAGRMVLTGSLYTPVSILSMKELVPGFYKVLIEGVKSDLTFVVLK